MARPIPHDPRQTQVSPEDVDAKIAEIFNEPVGDLPEEVDQLNNAHEVLRAALQEN
ncbi:hypothetical protein [Corynebacterium sp. HMSC04H06]|uniref:hypothetical protein n=1 Tax=Corynebacterium sp. HMSC04H06 TaxID=1581050 RepID=UPI00143A6A55|nr:hypothetical protein [Corynebacterium sp. HMSC04H06]